MTDGTRYYYTVKAVADYGEIHPSNEDDDAPMSGAIPWDSPTPGAVLSAFRSVYPDTEGQLRVVGPDGRVYQDGQSEILPPDGYVIPGTNQFVWRHDEIAISLFDESEASGMQLLATNLPAADGPYRRVKTKLANGYAGAQGRITLPKYKGTGCFIHQRKGDFAYIMLGSTGGTTKWEVDAGVLSQYLPNQEPPEGEGGGKTWAPYIKSRGSDPNHPLVNIPPGEWGRFNPDQDLEIRYHARATLPGRKEKVCALKIYSESQDLTRTLGSYAGCKEGENVRVKRTHSIAHKAPQGWKGVKKTGSYCERVYWNSGQLKTSSGGWTNWSSGTSDEDGKFTGGIATISWYPTSPHVREDDIRITIPSE